MTGSSTRVALTFVAERMNVWLRFGRPAGERVIDGQRRVVKFSPGAVFCRIRWEANEYGTTLWQLAILLAVARGERMQRVSGILPGAKFLLLVDGGKQVPAVLRVIDAIETLKIDPADVAPSYWRMVHNRLAARIEAAPYSHARHAAYLVRRSFA